MRMFLTLLKMTLNVTFGISALKYRFTREKKKRWEPVAIGLGAIFGIGSLVLMFSLFLFAVFVVGKQAGSPEIVLVISFVAGQFFVLIFGIFQIISSFYFSRDMEILIPLPLKPYQVLGSKFVAVAVNQYLLLLPAVVPAVFIYGIGMQAGIFYWVKAAAVFLASPVIPLAVGAVFVVILMRFVNIRRSKDVLVVIGGFFGIFFGLGVNILSQRLLRGREAEIIQNLSQSGVVELLGRKFPPSIWATYGLARTGPEGIGYFLLFIGISALLFVFLLWLGNQVFYKGVLAGQEVARKRKALSARETAKNYRKAASPLKAMFRREWKLLFRTPVYAMNGLVGAVIGPIIIGVMFLLQREALQPVYDIIGNPAYAVFFSLGGLGFMLFSSGMNIVASTSLSREGRTFWISKVIPVSARQQVLSKLLHATAVSVMGIAVTAVIFIALFRFSAVRVTVLLLLGLMGSVLINALDLMIDVLRPKLDWTNPQEAVKTNVNGFFGMLVTLVVAALLAGAAVPMLMFKLPEWAIYTVLFFVLLAASAAGLAGLFALAEYKYRNMEM